MNALAARRRHPAALFVLLLVALLAMGSAYALAAPKQATAAADTSEQITKGRELFQANCATCHGSNAEGRSQNGKFTGPSLAGVGAASVDFQMGTGRMPAMNPGVQVRRNTVLFSDEDIAAVGAYVASLAPGPAVPTADQYDAKDADVARGGEIYRTNCAMCHNASGTGGALTRGKFAPTLHGVQPKHIYEAMLTGPQSMPNFTDTNLDPKAKADVIAYLQHADKNEQPGGFTLGSIGPVPEGMLAWTLLIGLCVGAAVWLGKKAA